jgi:hypothetical protein
MHPERDPMGARRENPILSSYRERGNLIVFARREFNEKTKKNYWLPVDSPFGEDVYAHIWTPISQVVDDWLVDYRKKHNGKHPNWEEVARKEYRACAVAKD